MCRFTEIIEISERGPSCIGDDYIEVPHRFKRFLRKGHILFSIGREVLPWGSRTFTSCSIPFRSNALPCTRMCPEPSSWASVFAARSRLEE
jgi:hypothetical protein